MARGWTWPCRTRGWETDNTDSIQELEAIDSAGQDLLMVEQTALANDVREQTFLANNVREQTVLANAEG